MNSVDPATPTADEVAEWVALAEKATEGPWEVEITGGRDITGEGWSQIEVSFGGGAEWIGRKPGLMLGDHEESEDDAAFIAAARTAVPALAAALSSERAVSAGLRAEVERLTNWNSEVQHRLDTLAQQHVQAAGRFYTQLTGVAAERDALQAQVQAVEAILDTGGEMTFADLVQQIRAAIAAAQPTKETQ